MFDIGWSELLVIGALALIVVGPKELPGMLRTCGQYVSKARRMARDFQRTMEDAADAADLGELKDVQKSMADWNRKVGPGAPKAYAKDFLKGDEKKPEGETPAAGSHDAADAAENAAWAADQEALRKAEAEAAGQAVPGPSPSTPPSGAAPAPSAEPSPGPSPGPSIESAPSPASKSA